MSKRATESTLFKVNNLLEISDSYQAPEKVMEILKDKERRKELFFKFLKLFDYDLSYEWFYKYFQDEHADRKNSKQDFTPRSVSNLMSEILDTRASKDGYCIVEEPAAGTGSTIIAHLDDLGQPIDNVEGGIECPACGTSIDEFDDPESYCFNCGQALDWRERK